MDRNQDFEYPDIAGYPDGMGFLDEGTASRQLPNVGPEPSAMDEGES
jgi:hypothetical protein